MLIIDIPGRGRLELEHLVLDMNGTLALDGVALDGVSARIDLLRGVLAPVVLTADTHGGAARLAADLGITVERLGGTPDAAVAPVDPGACAPVDGGGEAAAKAAYVRRLGADHTVAIGNGANDVEMLRLSAVGVCVIGREGAAGQAVAAADIVVTDINDALDLLLRPRRLVATLRC